jgi:hypothetical protein
LSTFQAPDALLSKVAAFLAFLPQILLMLGFGMKYYKDLGFCFFLQTLAFVAFNKVITAQVVVCMCNIYAVFHLVFISATASFSINKSKINGGCCFGCSLVWRSATMAAVCLSARVSLSQHLLPDMGCRVGVFPLQHLHSGPFHFELSSSKVKL